MRPVARLNPAFRISGSFSMVAADRPSPGWRTMSVPTPAKTCTLSKQSPSLPASKSYRPCPALQPRTGFASRGPS